MIGIGEIFFGLLLPIIFRKGIVISGREKFFSRPEMNRFSPRKYFFSPRKKIFSPRKKIFSARNDETE